MKKRKAIAIGVSILVVGVLVFLFHSIAIESGRQRTIAQKLETIPDFVFYQLCGTPYTQNCLNRQQAAVLIYFTSDCDFCIHKIRNIAQHLYGFSGTQLLFISPESIEAIEAFAKSKGLLHQPDVLFFQDRRHVFLTRFEVSSSPHTLVYDKNGNLLRRFAGQVLATTIIRVLQEND